MANQPANVTLAEVDVKATGAVRNRKPKNANSDLFDELLSAANALSVSERTRLVKSLAGQLGLVTVGSAELISKKSVVEKKAPQNVVVPPRPNPLKGTSFDIQKSAALEQLRQAKTAAGTTKLSDDHPAVLQYAAALASYKEEHKRLAVVSGGTVTVPTTTKKAKARTTTERSPERTQSTVISRVKSAVGTLTGARSEAKKTKSSENPMDLL